MRKLIVAAATLAVFGVGWSFGQQNAVNGTTWKKLDLVGRAFYVRGFDDGHVVGMREGTKRILEVIKAVIPPSSLTPEQRKRLIEKAGQIDQESMARSKPTMGQLETTISTFYGDYRNMPICWDDAVSFSYSSLKGIAPTEEELSAARKKGAESGCER